MLWFASSFCIYLIVNFILFHIPKNPILALESMWIISLVAIYLRAQDSPMCMQVLEVIVQMEIQIPKHLHWFKLIWVIYNNRFKHWWFTPRHIHRQYLIFSEETVCNLDMQDSELRWKIILSLWWTHYYPNQNSFASFGGTGTDAGELENKIFFFSPISLFLSPLFPHSAQCCTVFYYQK